MASAWRHPLAGVVAAWGLVWLDGAPDGSDTQPQPMALALQQVSGLMAAGDRVLGEAGPLGRREDVLRQRDYWAALWRWADDGVRRGNTWNGAESAEVGPPEWRGDGRHALNAQRAWRLAEDALLAGPTR